TEFPEIPIIVLTGQEDEAIAVEAVKQGAQDYLVKGLVDGKQLVRSIQYALERKRMAVDLTRARDELEKRVEERTAELTRSNRKLEKQIMERKLAAEELKQSEERFRAIFEGANDFIFIKDLSLRYTHINPATAKLFGVPASEMLGKTAEDILKKEAAQYIREADIRVLKGESIEEITTREIRGVSMTFHEVRVPMHNGSGEIIGVCGISRDITDLNRLQDTQKFVSQEYRSEIMKAVLKQAAFAASTKSVVLLLGESGVGKDYLAKYIHKRSNYSSGSYYSINCAAVPLELAESELFGHEAGAFTGAGRRKRGLLELAEGGTLLLNEVGELSPALQAKFLTFLDTRTFTRVGGQQIIRVNARILAATNRDLQHEISIGRFRADLYYRLNVFSIRVPPLRERIEDLPILVAELLSILAKELQMSFSPELAAGEMAKLYNYQWPGNIRELRNVLERAVILSGGGAIKVDIDGSGPCDAVSLSKRVSNITDTSTLAGSMDNLSRAMIEGALARSKGRKELAASYLGVSRYTLRRWIQKLGINVRK
ncbi:MAG: sigma 54-interacting transcriptional regulator, partial [Desulfomonilaceae bacterium]